MTTLQPPRTAERMAGMLVPLGAALLVLAGSMVFNVWALQLTIAAYPPSQVLQADRLGIMVAYGLTIFALVAGVIVLAGGLLAARSARERAPMYAEPAPPVAVQEAPAAEEHEEPLKEREVGGWR
ncbi:MAG TPA: hypothetical protein VNL77_11650 [Roseiflexaceae bacterium]|nr:hypothetical protein [Roseiflexaceae bacterium]